jgi:glycine hydroxymethyltransferase
MDKQLHLLIQKEVKRQNETLDLIPSENIADPELLKILGSPLVNKYSEGYSGKRYYPGNEYYDEIEELAQARALQAFNLSARDWGVNVQALSGSPANLAIYMALMKPGDTLMGLKLSHGGHLTHGHPVSFSGMLYRSVPYTLGGDGYIDYEHLAKLATKHRPTVIISGATAYPRIIDFKRIGAIAKKVGAYHTADISHIAGLIAGGAHPTPFPYADVVMATTHKTLRGPRGAVIFSRKVKCKNQNEKLLISEAIDKAVFPGLQGGPHNNVTAAIAWTFRAVQEPKFKRYAQQIIKNAGVLANELKKKSFTLVSGGTDTHLMLIDLRSLHIDGSTAQSSLERVGISANRNTIPNDASPFTPSGIRLGTPSLTSRGMKEKEMKHIAELIYACLVEKKNVTSKVKALTSRFPLPYTMSNW